MRARCDVVDRGRLVERGREQRARVRAELEGVDLAARAGTEAIGRNVSRSYSVISPADAATSRPSRLTDDGDGPCSGTATRLPVMPSWTVVTTSEACRVVITTRVPPRVAETQKGFPTTRKVGAIRRRVAVSSVQRSRR